MVLGGSSSEGPSLRASLSLGVQSCRVTSSLPSPLGHPFSPLALENHDTCVIYFFILREPVRFFKVLEISHLQESDKATYFSGRIIEANEFWTSYESLAQMLNPSVRILLFCKMKLLD